MKYIYKTRVPFSQTGVHEGLSVIGAAQIIEDSFCAFFASFGKDSESIIKNYNAFWVIVANKFQMRAVAAWNEEIVVESYLTEIRGATVVVDTVVKNSKGEIALAARTKACVIDRASQRIRRLSSVEFPEDMPVYMSGAGFDFTKKDGAALKKEYEFTVPSTAIDFCLHVNNVEYLRFILNAASAEKETENPVCETEIHYINQSREGDALTVLSDKNDGNEYYEIRNGDKVIAKCNIRRSK